MFEYCFNSFDQYCCWFGCFLFKLFGDKNFSGKMAVLDSLSVWD